MGLMLDYIKNIFLTEEEQLAVSSMENTNVKYNDSTTETTPETTSSCIISHKLTKLELGFEISIEVKNTTEEDYLLRGLRIQLYNSLNSVLDILVNEAIILPNKSEIVLKRKVALRPSKLNITYKDITHIIEIDHN